MSLTDQLGPFPDLSLNVPAPQGAGMFGGGQNWRNALLAAVAGFMARRSPGAAGNIINGLQDAQTLKQKLAIAQQERAQQFQDARLAHQQDRQFDIANPLPTQPDSFESAALAGGYVPGTPDYQALMKRRADELADPVVMTPYGPMLRSQALSMSGGAKPLTDADIERMGGQTPPASGGFPGH